jgi:hypothetical protein
MEGTSQSKLTKISSETFRQVNIRINKTVLDSIDKAVESVNNSNENFNVTRSTLIHALLLSAINSNNKFISLDDKQYTFNELLELSNNKSK